jgi:hypothetical protein
MTCFLQHYGSNELLLSQVGQELIDPAVRPLVRLSHDTAKVQYHTRTDGFSSSGKLCIPFAVRKK